MIISSYYRDGSGAFSASGEGEGSTKSLARFIKRARTRETAVAVTNMIKTSAMLCYPRLLASSITGIMDQATQIDYATENTYQDSLAKYRLSHDEKAESLDLSLLPAGRLLPSTGQSKNRAFSTNL